MNIKRELAIEHQKRIKAERERDNLKNLINTSAANNNLSADITNINSFGASNGLPLSNDNSFDSINGSSTTTASTTSSSVCNSNILGDININTAHHNGMMNNNHINTDMSMPTLQPTNSYQSNQSHSTHHTRSTGQQSPAAMVSNMQQIGINNPSFQINHMQMNHNNGNSLNNPYGPAIPPIVNTNNFS